MAVRRKQGPAVAAPLEGVDRLLDWSRWRPVPQEYLRHPDPKVRRLAEVTEEAVRAFRGWCCSEGPAKDQAEAHLRAVRRKLAALRSEWATAGAAGGR